MAHFDTSWLTDGATSHTKVASDRLELLANTAAKRYVEEQTPLTHTIRKIASENDLNSNQIERICEMANIATHRALFPKAASKEAVAFPLADAQEVVNVVGKKPLDPSDASSPMVSPCSMDSDYSGPPQRLPIPGPSTMSMLGADPAKVHNGLHEEPEDKRIIIVIQKKAAEQSDLKSKILYKGMELESLEKRAYKEVKQTILEGATFYELYKAASAAGLDSMAEKYLPKWQDQIISESHGSQRLRLEKIAITKAPAELISENLGNMTVINGAHPVLVSLDTVNRKTGEIKQGLNNYLRIEDELKVFNQRLRELS